MLSALVNSAELDLCSIVGDLPTSWVIALGLSVGLKVVCQCNVSVQKACCLYLRISICSSAPN